MAAKYVGRPTRFDRGVSEFVENRSDGPMNGQPSANRWKDVGGQDVLLFRANDVGMAVEHLFKTRSCRNGETRSAARAAADRSAHRPRASGGTAQASCRRQVWRSGRRERVRRYTRRSRRISTNCRRLPWPIASQAPSKSPRPSSRWASSAQASAVKAGSLGTSWIRRRSEVSAPLSSFNRRNTRPRKPARPGPAGARWPLHSHLFGGGLQLVLPLEQVGH